MHRSPLRTCHNFTSAHAIIMGLVLTALQVSVTAETLPLNCAAELDATVTLASNADSHPVTLAARFAALEKHWPAFAQLTHNQGVLAARDNRWSQEIGHFEHALQIDKRAADTHRHLQQIFEHRAAEAYARVLDTANSGAPLPDMRLQDSTVRNADASQPFSEHQRLRDVPTLEYELYAVSFRQPSKISP